MEVALVLSFETYDTGGYTESIGITRGWGQGGGPPWVTVQEFFCG